MDGKLRNMTSVYFTGSRGVLCLFRVGSRVANHKYVGAAGGHFEKDELNDARACVLREMKEELGLVEKDIAGLQLRYITHRLKDGEIRQNYYFFAALKEDLELTSTEGQLHWFSVAELPGIPMPVSARHMMDHYLAVGRFDNALYAGITCEKGTQFYKMEEFDG